MAITKDHQATAGPRRKSRPAVVTVFIIACSLLLFLLVYILANKLLDKDSNDQGTAMPDTTTGTDIFRSDGALSFHSPDGRMLAGITIEIASTPASREAGLMGRTTMKADRGMLFVFDEMEERSFWMANTPLSLDIIYVNDNNVIVKIQTDATPYSEASIPSVFPAMYVVEVNAGFCALRGIREGDRIDWVDQR